jgi:integrase
MKRGVLTFGGNTVNVWIKMVEGEIRATSARPKESVSFQKFSDKYIAETIPNFKPASQSSLKSNIVALNSFFGPVSLASIDAEKIQAYVASCAGIAPKTIKNRLGTMKMVWRRARAWGYADGNPFEFVSLPRAELKEAKSLSVDEVRSIIRATSGEFNMMLRILAETGCRGGELVALAKTDIDLDARVIRIRRSAFQGKLQTPKTGNAVRTIHISGQLARELSSFAGAFGTDRDGGKDHLMMPAKHNPIAGASELFFPYKGNPWNNGEIVRRLKPVLGTGAGLHAFRHANISLMASLGVPLHIQKERIGHASGDITARYTHSSPEDHKKYAEIIGQALCTENVLRATAGGD